MDVVSYEYNTESLLLLKTFTLPYWWSSEVQFEEHLWFSVIIWTPTAFNSVSFDSFLIARSFQCLLIHSIKCTIWIQNYLSFCTFFSGACSFSLFALLLDRMCALWLDYAIIWLLGLKSSSKISTYQVSEAFHLSRQAQ